MWIEIAIQYSFFEMKDPTVVMALFLVREAAEFPIVLQSDTRSVYCNEAWDKLGKSFVVEKFFAFKSSSFNDFILRKR